MVISDPILWEKDTAGNLKKFTFSTNKVTFLGHIVIVQIQAIEVDGRKGEVIKSLSVPKSIHNVKNFMV